MILLEAKCKSTGSQMSILSQTPVFLFPHFFFLYKIHTNYDVIQGFPAPRNAVTTHANKYHIFSSVFDIANQLLTRQSPFAPLGQVR